MKILITSFACEPGRGSEPGAGWDWVSGLAKHHNVHVIAPREGEARIQEAQRHIPTLTVHYLDCPFIPGTLGWLICYAWHWRASSLAKHLHATERFDLCHALNYFTWRVPSFLWRLGIPFVWGPIGGGQRTPRGFGKALGTRGRLEDVWRNACNQLSRLDPLVRLTMLKATRIAVANSPTMDLLPASARARATRVHDCPGRRVQRSTVQSGQGVLEIVWLGKLLPWKGLALLIHALARVHVPYHLSILGDGPDRNRIARLAEGILPSSAVAFVGWVKDERWELMSRADVFVFTSLHDTTGAALMEALSLGLPVIMLNCSGGEMIPSDAAIKIEPTSAASVEVDMAAALEWVARNPEAVRDLGRRGKAFATSQLGVEESIEAMLSLYRAALGNSSVTKGLRRLTS